MLSLGHKCEYKDINLPPSWKDYSAGVFRLSTWRLRSRDAKRKQESGNVIG